MQIDWWTLALQVVNFLVLIWLLWRFLYHPVREVIEKRKQLAEKAFADADEQKCAAEAARKGLEEDRRVLERERQKMLKTFHEELETERQGVLEEAREKAEKVLVEARESIAAERAAAVSDLREQVAELAVELASELLRNAGENASIEFVLEQLERQLKTMPAEERERLRTDLAADDARLTVITAGALASDEQARWADRIGVYLGQTDKIDFAIDPAILGGAELRLPHTIVKLTWAEQLRKAKALMENDEVVS